MQYDRVLRQTITKLFQLRLLLSSIINKVFPEAPMARFPFLKISSLYLLVIAMVFSSCEPGTDINGSPEGMGTLEVLLHDAPGDYKEVNIFVERVEVNNTESNGGWIEVATPEVSVDLLELTNGNMQLLGSEDLEPGTYEQIRLILNNEKNNLVVGDQVHDLFVPSGEQTGVKINVNAEIEEGITYSLLLDFDVARSIVERGNEKSGIRYLLKPVINATSQAVSGRIAGTIEPAEAHPWIYAIANEDTVSSTKADTSDGSFQLVGLEEGSYSIAVEPGIESYQPFDTTGVKVEAEETTDLGIIELSQDPGEE